MNQTRIIGLLLVSTGIILNRFFSENDFVDFLMGLFLGTGLILLITGRIKKSK